VSDIGATFARRIPASSPALQMLLRYLDLARRDNVVTTPELAAAFTDHVCDLLAIALGPTRDAAEQARTRGLPAARLQAIKDDIADNLGRLFVWQMPQRRGGHGLPASPIAKAPRSIAGSGPAKGSSRARRTVARKI
jgi:hypothetical protein